MPDAVIPACGLGQPEQERERPELPERVDVVVVGGRIAGCAIATRLARAGRDVLVLERDEEGSDSLSTHVVQDLRLFAELGAAEEILATGAPALDATILRIDGTDLSARHTERPRFCVRRPGLDAAMQHAAVRAGARLAHGAPVRDVHVTDGRIQGVVVVTAGGPRTVRASLVIGADGRNSTVARLVGARHYAVTTNERMAAWGYFRGLPIPSRLHLVKDGVDVAIAAPCDGGITMVAAQPLVGDTRDWRDTGTLVETAGRLLPLLRGPLTVAEPIGGTRVVRRMNGYFRESAGPGWVLLGDAGHFKDVVVGQGISDALRQAQSLADAVDASFGDPAHLDAETAAWTRRRDLDSWAMYCFAQDMGREATSSIERAALAVLAGSRRRRRLMHQVLDRRSAPGAALAPAVLGRAVLSSAWQHKREPSVWWNELSATGQREVDRRRSYAARRRGPDFAS